MVAGKSTRQLVQTMISQVNMLVVLFNNILDRRMIKLGQFKVSKELFGPTNKYQNHTDVYKNLKAIASHQQNQQNSSIRFAANKSQ